MSDNKNSKLVRLCLNLPQKYSEMLRALMVIMEAQSITEVIKRALRELYLAKIRATGAQDAFPEL